ncbi:photosynthetic reaction center subunit H [Thalassococcus sp. S3]|uniref:photosynthetic reaction center subunit H n=1 Tax=Thalassococcus sp. S3 TaxID=2017482 RepID=UPI00102456D5|nr:photosynthetic reaction center subunit H [Thalassococcus sp. S3]QBF34226.1 photosynthetic reaction center subunit H [Thalassococcus sp. S3]
MVNAFFGEFDLASLTLWLFYGFFALLIIYIQRENMREGYPMEDDDGNVAPNQGPYPLPEDKTFKLPHGRGEVTVPSGQNPDRKDLALRRTSKANGFPMEPTGDPMLDGVGPASWAPRRDVPELDGHGHPKIVPMSANEAFAVAAGRDPRGLPVMSGDGEIVGEVTDMWIDEPEQLVRYLEYKLDPKWGEGTRLVPMTLVRIWSNQVKIKSIYAKHFATVPTIASPRQVTLLEEEKISAYYGGGKLYADSSRLEPQI